MKMLYSSLLPAIFLCFTSFNAPQSFAKSKELWQDAPSLPYRVQEIYPTVFANHIVVAGGLSPDVNESGIAVSDRFVVFNLDTGKWQDGPTLPEPRHHPMLVVVEKRLFSFGGFTMDGQGVWHNSTDVMELVGDGESQASILRTGKWKRIAQMPAPLAETLGAVHNGKVHLVSGRTPIDEDKNSQWRDQTDVDFHFIFNPDTLIWTEGEKVPTARNSACSVTLNGKLHTIAGRTVAGGNLATHEAYDFDSSRWQTLAPLPDAQGGLACAVSNQRIYVFGGEFFDNGGGVYADVWEYEPKADTWQSVSKMPNPRHGLGALAIGDAIYVIAGASQAGGNQTSSAMTVFMPR